jgi:hypothetical protein
MACQERRTDFLFVQYFYSLLHVKTLMGMTKLQTTTSKRWFPCDVWRYLYATMVCIYGVVEQTGVDMSLIVSCLRLHGAGWSLWHSPPVPTLQLNVLVF